MTHIVKLEDESSQSPPPRIYDRHPISVAIITALESAYHNAERVRKIFEGARGKPPVRLPYLKEPPGSDGVRDVRNHLIEHPEGNDSRVTEVSWAWDLPEGPVCKPQRREATVETHPDSGLWVNLGRFRRGVEEVLLQAIDQLLAQAEKNEKERRPPEGTGEPL